VTAVDDTNGTWQFSTNSGTSWIAFGSVSSSSAVVLDTSAFIRFLPDGVFNGMIDPGITFHAWDASDGLASGTTGVNASTPGDTSAFSAATETASIDVVLESAPIATDDTYHILVTNTLSKVTGDADDLLDNDDLGSPDLGAIATFGGGSLGGGAGDNSFGASVSMAGGTLTVNDDGSFSMTNPTLTGNYTFDYQISNTIGNDIGTVSIQVRETPVAVDDTVTSASSPGDTYHTPLDTLLSVPDGTTDLLTNDTIGFPIASLTLFGASTADTTVGTAGATANGGTLTVNGDGSFNYTPPSPSGGVSFTGEDTFVYQLDNGVVAPSTATVTLAVGDRPTAVDDAYTAIGNIVMTIDSANGVLGNDAGDEIRITRFDGDADTTDGKTVDGIETITTSNGSTVLLNTDGSFLFTPATGFTGTDTFYYTMGNGFGTQTGQVDITIDDIVWFIDNSEAVNGDGSEDSPFNSLGAFDAVNDGTGSPGTGDYIYIAGTGTNYTNGLTLQDNQVLIGEGTPGTLQPFLESLTGRTYDGALGGGDGLPTLGGANPILENTQAGGNGITLAADNQIYGITIGNTGNTNDGIGISGNNFGTLILRDTIITDNGRLLDLSTGTLDAEFDELTSLSSSGGAAVRLDAVSTTGSHLRVSSTGLGTRISNASGGLDIQNSGSGSMFNFGNTAISDSGAGVNLLNNTGASFTFGTLNITENTAGSGIVAAGGGTITTTQGNISVKGGSALDLDGIATNLNLNAVTTSNRITAIGIVFTDTSGSIDLGAVSVSDSTPIAANAIYINNSTADVTIGNINIGNIGTDAVVLDTYSGNFAINGGSIEDVGGAAILGTAVAGTFNVTETSILNATTGLSLSTATVGSPTLVANITNTDFGASGRFIEETGISITANGDSTVQLTLNGDGQNFQIITDGFETTENGIVIHANDTSTVTFDLNEYFIRTAGTGVVLNQVAGSQYILPGYSGASSGDLSAAIATYLSNAGGQNNDLSTAATQVDAQGMTNVTG
ncbi:MAG: Ig-like domain-containing protein, partial [Leptolyngbyaceae bacterium]|nr:Ig-like domain-containing protein [Leptolyngbyaceae bacterium]